MTIERVLMPTDFSETSQRAVPCARLLARAHEATVHVLHVCEPAEEAFPAPEVGVLLWKVPPNEALVRQALERFAEQHFSHSGLRVVTAMACGDPAREITRYAIAARIDRIVTAPRSRGLLRWFHRSVSQAVLENTPCPVLLVPPEDAERAERDDESGELSAVLMPTS
jgi:nucleotide-binding universal stress UspA family protein